VNEEPLSESSLNLTLTQHHCDEDLKSRKVHVRLEVEPPQAWYYHISLNFCTLVILLQVNPVFSDEPEIVYEGCYKIKDTLVCTTQCILDFL
jgi:hypothetical protein